MVQINSVETISMDITFIISCIFRLLWTTMGGQPTFAQRHKSLGKSVDYVSLTLLQQKHLIWRVTATLTNL